MRGLVVALPRALAAVPARIATRPVRIQLTHRTRRRLVAAAGLTVLAGSLYQFWLRDSSLVAVERVDVTGLTTKEAPTIQAALQAAAEEMTTLHVDKGALDAVADQFPAVASIAVSTDFPHGLTIHVAERPPAALVMVGEEAVPAAADGMVLTGARPPAGLPVLATAKPASGGRLTDPETLRALVVLGAAPAGLPQRIDGVSEEAARGIVLELEDGPEILFGDADRAEAKWIAAARVLADPEAAGASYIDVRLPERPVAGGLPVETIEPVVPAGEPIEAPPAAAVDPATGAPLDPATGEPVDPSAAAPAEAAAPPATDPLQAAPAEPQATPTGGVTSP